MNENIDLTKILKDCPKGTFLWSKVHGPVEFQGIIDSPICPISTYYYTGKSTYDASFTKEGSIDPHFKGECLLFPSKEQRDWSKFTAPWYKNVSSQTNEHTWLHLVSDVLTWKDGIGQYLDNPEVQEIAKRLCNKYAQKLYNPSVLSNSSNTGKGKQKFDPNTLRPFDKVLGKNGLDIWRCDFFSSYMETYACKNVCIGGSYLCCIPYNDDTKHLVGTNDEAPEYYRYWED